ncbi:MAG: hypothetical protein RLZ98_1531 [Pseudomonadota bacterium]|jgi:uncharacterized protein (DUF427 family)
MKLPSPAHPITIEKADGCVTVRAGGETVAKSENALLMLEGGHTPVFYIPRADTRMDLLVPTSHATYCSYKGDASYFSIRTAEGRMIEDAVWSYEKPYPAVAAIGGHLAFYPSKVDTIDFETAA